MSMRWCGMPRRSAAAILSVPMSKPRYTAVESQLTISPLNRSATASASALFPVAVGPRIATSLLDTHEHVDDEHDQKDEQAELLRACHFLSLAGPHPRSPDTLAPLHSRVSRTGRLCGPTATCRTRGPRRARVDPEQDVSAGHTATCRTRGPRRARVDPEQDVSAGPTATCRTRGPRRAR